VTHSIIGVWFALVLAYEPLLFGLEGEVEGGELGVLVKPVCHEEVLFSALVVIRVVWLILVVE